MKLIQYLLRLIYYPLGWIGDFFDFIAGKLADVDDNIQQKKVMNEGSDVEYVSFENKVCDFPCCKNKATIEIEDEFYCEDCYKTN
jgi:hypothetical protein